MGAFPSPTTYRPAVTGGEFMVSTGHYLATMAAVRMLESGGNAIDAGVAAGLCINVVQPDMTNIGGVAPIILYSAEQNAIRTISGLGSWPEAASSNFFLRECGGEIPAGVHRSVMPAAIDSWLTALKLFGTRSLAEVAASAIALAERGFPVYRFLHANLDDAATTLARWPSTAAIYLPGGRAPRVGERLVQADLAGTLKMLAEAEETHRASGREAAIEAARDRFYAGDIAERVAGFFAEQGGFLTLDDLRRFRVDVESPVRVTYRGHDVYGCRPWCQGPVALQTLAILEGYDLAAMGHNSVDALHLIVEALKAAFADRERYYGDPKFVDVPIDGLLHHDYAATWRDRIAMERAADGMPEPGDPWRFSPNGHSPVEDHYRTPRPLVARTEPDTSYLCVVDQQGNAFSATPSDGVGGSPVVPGLGFVVSGRGVQSWLDPEHPSALMPGKRPRLTPNPGLIMKDGKVFAPYGTPGNDVQPQAMIQFVANIIDFGMDPQAAVEAPRVASYSHPQTTHPHAYAPNRLMVEGRIDNAVLAGLERRGHRVERWPDWSPRAGSLCGVLVDGAEGWLVAGADPRRIAYAMGW